jgi:hypothetical protein
MAVGSFFAFGVSLIFLLVCENVTAKNYHYDFQGPYCARRTQYGKDSCCDGREDDCSVPIGNTLCYCDVFCDRSVNGDCCPDYESVCLGAPPPPLVTCLKNRVYYSEFQTVKENCNECKCHAGGRWVCEEETCLVEPDMVEQINNDPSLAWTAGNYSEFWGRKFAEGLKLRLGTHDPLKRVKKMSKLSHNYNLKNFPYEFNLLKTNPSMISAIRDQGWCASSWAVSTATVASDRFSFNSHGIETVDLAPQQFLDCVRRKKNSVDQGCNGGYLDIAWNYFNRIGLVDEDCYPYEANVGQCKLQRVTTLQNEGCKQPDNVNRTELYKMGPAYPLRNETDIQYDIYLYGPVQATMKVYHDFFSYRGGVYRRSRHIKNTLANFHSVRLLGWGEERNGYETTKYWIAANSWGTWWGENGLFRIVRGENECGIEDHVLSALPELFEKNLLRARSRKHRKRNVKHGRRAFEYNNRI